MKRDAFIDGVSYFMFSSNKSRTMQHISRYKPRSLARDLHCNLYELRYRKRLYEDPCYYKRIQD